MTLIVTFATLEKGNVRSDASCARVNSNGVSSKVEKGFAIAFVPSLGTWNVSGISLVTLSAFLFYLVIGFD